VGAFRSLQLFNSDSGVGLRTQKRGFKRGIGLIHGKLYVKSFDYGHRLAGTVAKMYFAFGAVMAFAIEQVNQSHAVFLPS